MKQAEALSFLSNNPRQLEQQILRRGHFGIALQVESHPAQARRLRAKNKVDDVSLRGVDAKELAEIALEDRDERSVVGRNRIGELEPHADGVRIQWHRWWWGGWT